MCTDELIKTLIRKRDLHLTINHSSEVPKDLTYKSIGEQFGKTEDSTRHFARKLYLTVSDIL